MGTRPRLKPYLGLLLFTLIFILVGFDCIGPGEHGEDCRYQSDCVEACIKHDSPLGDGTCGPYRQEGETCTRPGYVLNDCDSGLRCNNNEICEQSPSGGSSSTNCGDEVCASHEHCITYPDRGPGCYPGCTSDSNCGSGECCITTNDPDINFCGPDDEGWCQGGGSDNNSDGFCETLSNSCLEVVDYEHGYCLSDGLGIHYRNVCNETIQAVICIPEDNGNWAMQGDHSGVAPGETGTLHTCSGPPHTSQIYYWVFPEGTGLHICNQELGLQCPP